MHLSTTSPIQNQRQPAKLFDFVMKPFGRGLFGFVYARTRDFAIALDGQDDRALARRHAGKCGFLDEMNRSLLRFFADRAKPSRAFQGAVLVIRLFDQNFTSFDRTL